MSPIDGRILHGVSSTALWTLNSRGTEAKRADRVIRDPWAVTLLDSIDFDYGRLGRPMTGSRRWLNRHWTAAASDPAVDDGAELLT